MLLHKQSHFTFPKTLMDAVTITDEFAVMYNQPPTKVADLFMFRLDDDTFLRSSPVGITHITHVMKRNYLYLEGFGC